MGAWLREIWASGRKRAIVGAVALLVVLAGVAVTVILLAGSNGDTAASAGASPPATATTPASPTATAQPSSTPTPHTGILDGLPMSDADWNARKDLLPIAVMFDNAPGAYPQYGLDKADIVYEAFVEGGITRFMGIYWSQEADYLEPIRSARTPFVVWADEYGALYAHAGEADTDNAANAGGQMVEWNIFALNAFAPVPSSAFYRDDQRYAPHNLVTGTLPLRAAAASLGYAGPPTVAPWLFKDSAAPTASAPAAEGIELNFEGERIPWELVQWHWDAASKSYLRYQFGGPAIDAKTQQQLRFTNVVVMQTSTEVVDDSGHVLLGQFGGGPATVFMDGRQIAATWKKADRKARTRYYDANGNEIAFNRGPIFIEVIGLQSTVTVAATVAELPGIPAYEPFVPSEPPSDSDDTPPPSAATETTLPTPKPSATPSASGTPKPSTTAMPSASGTPKPSTTATAPVTATPSTALSTSPTTVAPGTSTPSTPTPSMEGKDMPVTPN